jgi:hypothetical protein
MTRSMFACVYPTHITPDTHTNRRASGGTFGTGSDVLVVCNDSQTVRQLRLFISTKYTSINCTTTTDSTESSGGMGAGGRGSGSNDAAARGDRLTFFFFAVNNDYGQKWALY